MKRKAIIILFVIVFLFLLKANMATNSSIITNYTLDLSNENVVAAGINEATHSVFALGTKYKQPQQFVVYYGELKYSGIPDYSVYDFMVVSDRNAESVTNIRNQGTNIFQYVPFGSRFEDTDEFIQTMKDSIKSLQDQGLADGIFLDESDIAYWDPTYQNDPEKQQRFYTRLEEITDYIRSLDMESIVNGTRSFAELGDYFLWESFLGYWNANHMKWDNLTSIERTVASDGAVTYGRRWTDWTFEGTTRVEGGKVVGGEKGAMEIVLDMDQLLQEQDRREKYDWIYANWVGTGGSDETISVLAWTGESLPFDSNEWKALPKLWKGEAESWNGIGAHSKYVKLRFEFNGARDLNMEQVQLTFNYNYPYWNMSETNGDADSNPYMWNFNNSQLEYIQEAMKDGDAPIHTLTHSYGEKFDDEKIRYTFLGTAINDFYAWNYVDPTMQRVEYHDILEEPIGMLLKREASGNVTTGYFTGSTASIDTTSNSYTLERNEPGYYYNRAITIDGDMADWLASDQLYAKDGPGFAASGQFWGANGSTYSTGSFDNVQAVERDGLSVLELIQDGTGTWISGEQGMDPHHYKKQLSELVWNAGSEGSVNYSIQFQQADGSWTDWISQTQGTSSPRTDFYKFKVKVELKGSASREVLDPVTSKTQFIQGVSFWGSSHIWKIHLSDNVNVQGVWITDDSKYLYIRVKTAGRIDFSTNDSILSNNFYNIYIDGNLESTDGFKGSWWNTPNSAAKYRITNNGMYKWKENYHDQRSNDGWEWMGAASVDYKLNKANNEIEYRVKKSRIGDLTMPNIKVYMTAEEASTLYGDFVKSNHLSETNYTGEIDYRQKVFLPYVPHGYIKSEVIEVGEGQKASLTWEGRESDSTDIKAWIRMRSPGSHTWNDWVEVSKGKVISQPFDRIQYCFGLYTNSGDDTPLVSNINLRVEEKAIDE